MRRLFRLVVGGALLVTSVASAQTQIKARVLVMVDTSGSMTEHFTDNLATGGDGSTFYSDAIMTRAAMSNGNNGMYVGFSLPSATCPATGFDGVNSRLFAAKQAVTNVINGAGGIDWGLMRYSGVQCAVPNTTSGAAGACATDDDCVIGQFCIGGTCRNDDNLCFQYGFTCGAGCSAGYGASRTVGGACTDRFDAGNAMAYNGNCGTGARAGTAACATAQVCYKDSDCTGTAVGRCQLFGTGATRWGWCQCGVAGMACDGTNYVCSAGAPRHCVYNQGCQNPGGVILVDPATANPSPKVLPYVDGVEALPGNLAGIAVNPELRAVNGTPLAGAARSAAAWYRGIKTANSDPQITCRPYVLVQMTDGFDSCDADINNGPVAAAADFVSSTVANAKNPNKVYVVGLAFGTNPSPTLDAIAYAGGTGAARLANSQVDIEAALADIVSSSVLTEKCNGIDDNCNGQCDENFPGVAVTNPAPDGSSCSNPHPASTCDNGYPPPAGAGTGHCFDSGTFVCSTDQLSQVCSAQTCIGAVGGTLSSPAAGVMRVANVTNLSATMIGQLLVVGGASKPANNGAFVITAVGATTVDVANAGVTMPDPATVSYGVPTMQGKATITRPAAGTERLTLTAGATTKVLVGDQVIVAGALPVADNGTFTVTAVTATTIDLANAFAAAGTQPGAWADPRLCPGVETCNGIDDDCNGIVDDCAPQIGITGSCCTSACPTCAKPPFVETCNGCDDDCDGIVDNHLVDTGTACGSNVGDCAPGATQCCQADPNLGPCTQDQNPTQSLNKDKLWCGGGNPPYPTPGFDKCDGTDDNCNGVANDGPPQLCYVDQNNGMSFNPALDGVGACHHGTQACTTTPLGPGTPPCPVGWPAGKTCPNPVHTYDPVCRGGAGPHPEVCDGIDNDCNACIDDNVTDSWINQPCCSTGNPADCGNSGGSTRCKMGTWQCAKPGGGGCNVGGAKTCVGSIAKSPETCNMIDDDCNGLVDDLPGKGNPCTGAGIYTQGTCRAQLQCVYSGPMASPNLVCVQTVGPMAEVCNGLDDNCNGQVDDTNPPLAPPGGVLPGVGVACDVPMPPADKPPCKPGATVCQAGMIVCVGAVHPMPNQCNGISTDCTGMPNTNGNCPTGFFCNQGNCVAACSPGEFPCPGGYVCQKSNTSCGPNGCCIPDACAMATCPAGFNCTVDSMGNAHCTDPCASVSCPTGYLCKQGVCVDASCRTQGCPAGQVCTDSSGTPSCTPDPCANVTCMGNQYCTGGVCVGTCAGPCPPGQYCDKGMCVQDPCAHTACLAGQACKPQNGVGVCIDDMCISGCGLLQACCGGACISDPCNALHCPEDTHCVVNSACNATCETNPASPRDQIVGAGGGGFGCQVGGGDGSASSAWLLLFGLGALVARRRRARAAEVRR